MARGEEFVQIGDRVFNRRHIIGLTNRGKDKTVVITPGREFPVDVRMALAAKALGIGDFTEVVS